MENFLPKDLNSVVEKPAIIQPFTAPYPRPPISPPVPITPIRDDNNEKADTNPKPKKVNFFIKMSNSVARRPKLYLIFIMLLIVIIIILIVYYRGILFLGPFCPNNIKSKNYKKNITNGGNITDDNNKIIKSLKQ